MKLRFSLRHVFGVVTIAIVLLFAIDFLQKTRQRGADATIGLLRTLNCANSLAESPSPVSGGCIVVIPSKLGISQEPTLVRKIFGDTQRITSGMAFSKTQFDRHSAKSLFESRATKGIVEVWMTDVCVSPEAAYFLQEWDSLDFLYFIDIEFSEKWRRGVLNDSTHVPHMLFAGKAINLSAEEVATMSHLETLVLSNVGFSADEIDMIRTRLPETLVVVTCRWGEERSVDRPQASPATDILASKYSQNFDVLEKAVAQSGLSFLQIPPAEPDKLIAYQRQFQNPLPASLVAFLKTRTVTLPDDLFAVGLTRDSPEIVTMASRNGMDYTITYCLLPRLTEHPKCVIVQDFLKVGSCNGKGIWIGLTTGQLCEGSAVSMKLTNPSTLEALIEHYRETLQGYAENPVFGPVINQESLTN